MNIFFLREIWVNHFMHNVVWYKVELLTVDALTFLAITETPAAFWKRTKKNYKDHAKQTIV